ncbi:DUF423 domain-containing protein [Elioraea rosea]|uniref:DUF423 domain-containing protein n=1 Tax=Elioraea rosea TaxID=2492390 RepID=UPI001182205A|nr:DUF423 domain-containing protein [Elioraea rosea]
MERIWLVLGSLSGGTAVGLSALRAHALPQRLDAAALAMVDSALTMQGWHALALLAAALIAARTRIAHGAGACFAAGLILFCGAVYATAFAGLRLGPVAPLGGALLMAGWLLLAIAGLARWRGA